METAAKKLYEAMFLVDSGRAAADWDGTLATINNILKRADAEVVCLRKWGEKKLAYDIDHKSRGTYILCYFMADGSRITGIERDVQLSENIMRVLVLSTENRPPEVVKRDIAGMPAEAPRVDAPKDAEVVSVAEAVVAPEELEDVAPEALDTEDEQAANQ